MDCFPGPGRPMAIGLIPPAPAIQQECAWNQLTHGMRNELSSADKGFLSVGSRHPCRATRLSLSAKGSVQELFQARFACGPFFQQNTVENRIAHMSIRHDPMMPEHAFLHRA